MKYTIIDIVICIMKYIDCMDIRYYQYYFVLLIYIVLNIICNNCLSIYNIILQ